MPARPVRASAAAARDRACGSLTRSAIASAIASAERRDPSGVVILMFVASPSTRRTACPARSASVASSVASTRRAPSGVAAGRRAGTPAASARDRSSRAAASRGRSVRLSRPRRSRRPASTADLDTASPCRAPEPPPRRARLSAAAAIVRAIEIRARERPRRVVNHDDVARRIGGAKRVRDRILPPRAAGDDAQRLAGAAQIRRRIVGERLRQRDDDLVDRPGARGTPRRCARGSAGRRRQQLLRLRAAEALAASAGRDDRWSRTSSIRRL